MNNNAIEVKTMEKTKLGVSVSLLGAAAYLLALFGGYTPLLLLVGYIFLFEDHDRLKKTALKAFVLNVCFSLAVTAAGLIPDLLDWIASVVRVFDGIFDYSVIRSIFVVITDGLYFLRTCLFLLLGLKALKAESCATPIADEIVTKHMN